MAQPVSFNPRLALWWLKLQELHKDLRLAARLRAIECPRQDAVQYQQMHAVPTTIACLEGVVRVASHDRHIDLHPGEMVFVAPGAWHVHDKLKPGSLVFGQGLLAGGSDMILAGPDLYIYGRLPEEPYKGLFYRALAASERGACRDLLAQGLAHLRHESVLSLVEQPLPLRRMLAALYSNLHRPIDAGFLVRASGISRAQAYRLFTGTFGESPHQALTRQRLLLAEHLLEEGLDIAAVARWTGFPDRAAFTRSFRRAYGVPPGRWLLARK